MAGSYVWHKTGLYPYNVIELCAKSSPYIGTTITLQENRACLMILVSYVNRCSRFIL